MTNDLLDRLARLNPHESTPEPSEDILDDVVLRATTELSGPLRRSWLVAAATGLVIGLALIAIWAVRPASDGNDAAEGDGSTTTTPEQSTPATASPTTTTGALQRVTPISITCASELNSQTLACTNLIDGDPDTVWNDASRQGVGAAFTVTFAEPIALEQVHFTNVEDDVRFRRNYRVNGVEMLADDLPGLPLIGQLADDNERTHVVTTPTFGTTTLVIRVVSTHPAEAVDGRAFDELALAELEFWGRPAEAGDPVGEPELDLPADVPQILTVVRHVVLPNGGEVELYFDGGCPILATNVDATVVGEPGGCDPTDAGELVRPGFTSIAETTIVSGTAASSVARVEVVGQGSDDAHDGFFLVVVDPNAPEWVLQAKDSNGTVLQELVFTPDP